MATTFVVGAWGLLFICAFLMNWAPFQMTKEKGPPQYCTRSPGFSLSGLCVQEIELEIFIRLCTVLPFFSGQVAQVYIRGRDLHQFFVGSNINNLQTRLHRKAEATNHCLFELWLLPAPMTLNYLKYHSSVDEQFIRLHMVTVGSTFLHCTCITGGR